MLPIALTAPPVYSWLPDSLHAHGEGRSVTAAKPKMLTDGSHLCCHMLHVSPPPLLIAVSSRDALH